MVGLIILGIIVILLIALNLTPIALHISYEDALSVLAKIGTINLQIYPKEEKEKSEKKESGERKRNHKGSSICFCLLTLSGWLPHSRFRDGLPWKLLPPT